VSGSDRILRVEIESTRQLTEWLDAGRSLCGVRLQDIDLRSVESRLLGLTQLRDLVVLGGQVSNELLVHLQVHGAVVFPAGPDTPVDVFRAHLYTGHELYAGLDGQEGYAATVDSRAYEWGRDMRIAGDAYASLLKAIHDDSITDALDEWVTGRRIVGIMGGHAQPRGTGGYAAAARLGHTLASAGLVVATGGGPGAMEAANLGAVAPTPEMLDEALVRLRPVPTFVPDVQAWAQVAFEVLDSFGPRARPEPGSAAPRVPSGTPADAVRSLGVPTWFYGHEPPNVFAEGIAKYFSNAVREDGLLARSNAGVLVMPGAAGTVQEIFQLATRLYYAGPDVTPPPLVLIGVDHWVDTLPVWPLLRALGQGRGMADRLHLVDDAQEAAAIVS
jgi:predicted Rossmann-fold nucleotide-binding protein